MRWLVPADTQGKLVVDAYLNGNSRSNPVTRRLGRKILDSPGVSQSVYRYLSGYMGADGTWKKGRGYAKIPKIVGKHLGDHWYTGPAKLLAKTPIGHDYVVEKVLEKTLPKAYGDTSLARQFLAAGGRV